MEPSVRVTGTSAARVPARAIASVGNGPPACRYYLRTISSTASVQLFVNTHMVDGTQTLVTDAQTLCMRAQYFCYSWLSMYFVVLLSL